MTGVISGSREGGTVALTPMRSVPRTRSRVRVAAGISPRPPYLHTTAGSVAIQHQSYRQPGVSRPLLLQEHPVRENRRRDAQGRNPERMGRAVGSGACGYLEVTSPEASRWTRMK